MAEEVKKGGFDFYLRFAKPLVINLPDPSDRVLAAAWIQKLRNNKSGNEELRTNYLKLLLFVLQRKRLIGPFRENPNALKDLYEFPANIQIIDIAKSLLQADEVDRKDRLRGLIAGGSGDFPPYNIECSADLLEYAAAQDIPKFGVHAYYAISSAPITSWDNVDVNFLPKGVSLDKGAEGGEKNIATAASTPEVLNKSHLSMSDSRSKTRSRTAKHEKGSPTGKSPKRSPTKAVSPAISPLGSEAPVEDRSPPTWGSNLIKVTDPPDETSFNLSLASGINKADLLTMEPSDIDISSSHSMIPQDKIDDQSSQKEQPDWFQTPTDQFLQQFNSISISPGTEKSQDIIDEVNRSLLQSGRELSLSKAEAEIDARYPHRRRDMSKTPPIFSKHRTIREAGKGIQYSPQQFGISDEESFTHGPSVLEDEQYTPRQSRPVRADIRQQRLYSSMMENIEGDVLADDDVPDFLTDNIAAEVEEAIRTPKNLQKKLRDLFNEIEAMKETTPALGGVPVTTPKRSPSPGRKAQTPEFNIENELALYKEAFPEFPELNELFDMSADESLEKQSPYKSPRKVVESPRTRAARLRPESPPTPEKPDYDELMHKSKTAKSVLRPRTMRMRPTSTSREIRVYTKPVKHYKHPQDLNKIEESPEYKKTEEDRYTDLYEKLMAEDILMSPPHSPNLPPALVLSPFISPKTPIDDNFKKIGRYDNEDYFDSPDLYESPKRISPLKDLGISEKGMDDVEDIFEDVQFKFDFEPIDFGALAKSQNLYDENLPPPCSPPISCGDKMNTSGTPRQSPVRPKTPPILSPPPKTPPILSPPPAPQPSPPFYEMENLLTPEEFQDAIQAHEYTDRHFSRDPDRRLASELRTPRGGHRIPLPRYAPKPKLERIADKPLLEEILMNRDRLHPPAPPSPLPAGLPWRRQLAPGQIRIEDMPEEVQEKLAQPIPQRDLKEWEQFVFDSVIKPEDKDYFTTLFNEYNLTNEELIHPDIIQHRGLREPRIHRPPQEIEINEDFYPKPEIMVMPAPQVVFEPAKIADQSQMLKENLHREQDGGFIEFDAGWYTDDDENFDMSQPDDMDFNFDSPKSCVAGICPASPLTPEKPTYEELIANAKAAKKKRRPSRMELGSTTGRKTVKHHLRPLRHYEPLAYLDRIDESPYVSPEVDWKQLRDYALGLIPSPTVDLPTTPQIQNKKRRRGETRVEERAAKPRKLKFSAPNEIDYFATDSEINEGDRMRFNKLVATLPDLPPEPQPGDLLGQFYEHEFYQPASIIDKDIPIKHLKHQRKPLSPKRTDFFLPSSPVASPISPPKFQNMYADSINQVMEIDYPEEIEDENDMPPDPRAFVAKMPTRFDRAATPIEAVLPCRMSPCRKRVERASIPVEAVSPSSPFGLDTLFQSPQDADVFNRYPEDSHEMWMEYEPVEYIQVEAYKMDTPPKPKSPPKPKTPPKPPRAPSPKPESPLPKFMTPEEYARMNAYTRSPSPFLQEYYQNTPPHPKYKYGLTPTRPSPYKESHTPPGMPPAFAALEASPIQFTDDEPFVYLPSPQYENVNLNEGRVEDFDFSFASSASSHYEGSPEHLTATPTSLLSSPGQGSPHLTTPHSPYFSPLPSPKPISQNVDNWDLDLMANRIIAGDDEFDDSAEMFELSSSNLLDSPVCSPDRPCGSPGPTSPITSPRPLPYGNQFASPTTEEFKDIMESHEYTERHVSRDPHRELATKMLRSSKGNKPFRLQRHAPRPPLPTIFDYDESPEHIDIIEAQVPEIRHDLLWNSPEDLQTAPTVPIRYDTSGFELSPPRDFVNDLLKEFEDRNAVKRNLFDEFGEDTEMEDNEMPDTTPPEHIIEGFLQTSPAMQPDPIFIETPPHAFSPKRPEMYTPPSGSRRQIHTYTPPCYPSPVDTSHEELMKNIAESYASPTPYTMGIHSRTGYINNVLTKPVQGYCNNRMDPVVDVGEQYLTPPSGLRHPRRTYTPHPTPTASPRLTCPGGYTPPTPPSVKRKTYTPSPIQSPPSPHQWFSPIYTPPPHLRWTPPPFTPSPPKRATPPIATSSARRQLFGDSGSYPATPRTSRKPYQHGHPSPSPDLSFHTPHDGGIHYKSSSSEFGTPEESPSHVFTLEQEIIYNIEDAFADNQEANIFDTSDIPIMDDEDNIDFKWMG